MCRENEEAGAAFQTGKEQVDVGSLLDALCSQVFSDGSCAVPDPAVEEVELIVVETLHEIIEGFLPKLIMLSRRKGLLTRQVMGERISETSSTSIPAADRA